MLKRTCLQNALNAIAKANLEEMPLEQNGDFYGLTLLGRGVTYIVWLVSCLSNKGTICKFVLRVPKVIGMLPELRNEIGWLRYVSKHIPGVPIPKVYAFNITQKIDDCFIAEEYIVGEPLSKMWALYTDDEKHSVALKLAEVIVDLAAARFESICGLTPELEPGPAIEVPKLFECRFRDFSEDIHVIGEYKSTKEYVLSRYDEQIRHYEDMGNFDGLVGVEDVSVEKLRATRQKMAKEPPAFPTDEPFAISHGSFCGKNILMTPRDAKVAAVLHWKYAGAYPLSEVYKGSKFMKVDSDKARQEYTFWEREIFHLIGVVARKRGWKKEDADLLIRNARRDSAASEHIDELERARVGICHEPGDSKGFTLY